MFGFNKKIEEIKERMSSSETFLIKDVVDHELRLRALEKKLKIKRSGFK